MHSQKRDVELYLDGELSSAGRARFERHLTACAECRDRLAELQRLSGLLQRVTLPPALTRLVAPLVLPPRPSPAPGAPGPLGWLFGVAIVVAFLAVKTIFGVSGVLGWSAVFAARPELHPPLERAVQPVWLDVMVNTLGGTAVSSLVGDVEAALALVVPVLLYSLALVALLVLFATWMSLNWFGPALRPE
ncbi:MAG: anti-sigma factor family protein [Anaerolineae bacterium]